MGPWVHGADPLETLNYSENLKKLKEVIYDQEYIKQKIGQYFVNNKHRLTFIMVGSLGCESSR